MATEFGLRLRAARQHAGLTQVDAGKRTGIAQSTISTSEREGHSSTDTAVYARAYGVSAHWLATGEGEMLETNTAPGPTPRGPYPLISNVQAGDWTAIHDNFHPGDAEDWLPSTRNLGPHGYLLRVTGDSMTNHGGDYSFPAGTILHVNPGQTPEPGQFVVVRRSGNTEATFKRYRVLDGVKYLEAINPDWPKDLRFLALSHDDSWCGVVVDATMGKRLP